MKYILTIFLFFVTSVCKADPVEDIWKLNEYIAKHCDKGCVSAGELYLALVDIKDRVDPEKMLVILRVESTLKVKARNGGSVGLSQVMLRYHRKKFNINDFFNVKENIRVGSLEYEACAKKHKDNLRQSFRCYNGYHLGDKLYYSKVSKHLKEIGSLGLTF